MTHKSENNQLQLMGEKEKKHIGN